MVERGGVVRAAALWGVRAVRALRAAALVVGCVPTSRAALVSLVWGVVVL